MHKVGFIAGKFLPLHQGHVYAITRAAQMCRELYLVLSYSEKADEELFENSTLGYITPATRLRWLHQLAKDFENIRVISVGSDNAHQEDYSWETGAEQIKQAIGKPIDAVFSSEPSYTPYFDKNFPTSKHVIIDAHRERYNLSAAAIREKGALHYWHLLPKFVQRYFVKKVVIVGTESVGKSTLSRLLADHFNTTYAREYGRQMCEELGGSEGILEVEHFNEIAFAQKLLEKKAIEHANKVVFLDTEAIVTQYYSLLYLGKTNRLVEAVIAEQKYDLWLYLEPDVDWVADGIRKHGTEDIRLKNDALQKKMLDERGVNYHRLSGTYDERFGKAVKLVEECMNL